MLELNIIFFVHNVLSLTNTDSICKFGMLKADERKIEMKRKSGPVV